MHQAAVDKTTKKLNLHFLDNYVRKWTEAIISRAVNKSTINNFTIFEEKKSNVSIVLTYASSSCA